MTLLDVARGLRQWRDFVRLRPHDTSTEAGRTAERYRRVFLSAVGMVASRGLGLLTMFITVPLTVHYLGAEQYGMWMTISSFIAVIAFVDLGIGSGLMTSISHAHGVGDLDRARRLISTAFFPLCGLSLILLAALLIAGPLIPWQRLYNVTEPVAVAGAWPATAVFLGCNVLQLPFSLSEDVRTGFQSSFTHSLWVGVGHLASLVAVLIAIAVRAPLVWLVFTMAAGPLLAALLSFVSLFWFQRPDLRPAFHHISSDVTGMLLRTGAMVFILEVAVFVSQASDTLILSQVLGASSVTRYSITARLFSITPALLFYLTSPLWPAYGEAMARGDAGFVRRTLQRSIAICLSVSAAASMVLLVAARPFVGFWVDLALEPPFALVAALALWTVQQSLGFATSMFLNAAHVFRYQAIAATAFALISLALKVELTRRWGVSGVVWGTCFPNLLFAILPLLWPIPMVLRNLRQSVGGSAGARG